MAVIYYCTINKCLQYSMKSSDSESTRVIATRHSFSPKSRKSLEFCYKPLRRPSLGLKTYKRLHTWVPIGRLKIPVGRGLSNPPHPCIRVSESCTHVVSLCPCLLRFPQRIRIDICRICRSGNRQYKLIQLSQ